MMTGMLETGRLIIRRFVPEDWQDLFDYLSDPAVVLYEPYGTYAEDDCKAEAARRSGDEAFWAVCLKADLKVIGNIYLASRDFSTWELGFVFNSQHQGHGYATESAKAITDYAVRDLAAHRVIAQCNPQNTKSWELLEWLGMRREGHLRENAYFATNDHKNPIWHDTYEYAILASEWEISPR